MGIAVGVLSANYMTDTGEVSFASARKTVFSSSFENAVQKAARDSFEHSITDENPQKSTSYTRCITANMKVQNMVAGENEDGEIAYSYESMEQQFQIFITNDGGEKTYTIKGLDENGEEFEREFNPYEVDPENTDFPDFAALCLYIRQTENTADMLANQYFTNGDIFEKKDYLDLLGNFSLNGDADADILDCALNLIDALHGFMAERMGLDKFLFSVDVDATEEIEKLPSSNKIESTKYSKYDSITNPTDGKEIPIETHYITIYSKEGIICNESSKEGDKVTNKRLWEISYDSEEQYEKVQKFLSEFSDDDRLTFASNENFWKDFLKDNINLDEFKTYYQSTNNGKIDLEGQLAEGKSLREILTAPYANYFNNQAFVGEIYTEDTLGTSNNAASGSKRVEQLVKLYGEESPYSKALWGIGQAFDATFPNAPADVREAWIDMCIDSGMNQITGTSLDGKTSHLSQIMVQKAVNDYNIANGNFQNVDAGWGESVESIINILNKGIYGIDNPLPGDVEKSDAVKKLIENERAFYVSFLDKLELLD